MYLYMCHYIHNNIMSHIIYELRTYRGDSNTFSYYQVVTTFSEFFSQDMYLLVGNCKNVSYSTIDGVTTAYVRLYKEKSISWMRDHFILNATYYGIRQSRHPRILNRINEDGRVIYINDT